MVEARYIQIVSCHHYWPLFLQCMLLCSCSCSIETWSLKIFNKPCGCWYPTRICIMELLRRVPSSKVKGCNVKSLEVRPTHWARSHEDWVTWMLPFVILISYSTQSQGQTAHRVKVNRIHADVSHHPHSKSPAILASPCEKYQPWCSLNIAVGHW